MIKVPQKIRTRLAPSPTGILHIGTARTALFNYLFAKKNKGKFILRIEDTDRERSKPEFENDIIENLKWLGIEWDIGPGVSKESYRQSERLEIYEKYIKKLLEEDSAYYCFCSKEELYAQKQYQLSQGEAPKYNGKCRSLSEKEVEEKLKTSPFVIRLKTTHKKVIFNDLIRGHLEFDSNLMGDIVIARNTKEPLYNLAVVIDDFEMEITHIIRGEDHISNTPKQILLQEALGLPCPKYAHLPLILGPDRTKLSKRHGATAIAEYRKQGYLPETLINFMALLGWNPGTEREIFSISSLIKEFSLERVQKGGAIFNIKRLDWINGFYIRQKSLEKLTELCLPYLIEAGFIKENPRPAKLPFKEKKFRIVETQEVIYFDWIEKVIGAYQERLKTLSEIVGLTEFFFKEKLEYDKELLRWKDMSDQDIKKSLDKTRETLSEIDLFTKENIEKKLIPEGDRGRVLWPLRAALSGKKASAPPFEIAEILGKEKTLKRIEEAIKKTDSNQRISEK